jgi:aspartate racemase
MDFEQRVHRVSQRLIPQQGGRGYPTMVVHYCRHAPVTFDASGAPRMPFEPDPRLLEAARRLGAICDFLVIPCNAAHNVREHVERAAEVRVLSMIDLVLADVQRRGWKKTGVLGMGDPVVYTQPMAKVGLRFETIGDPLRGQLNAAIFKVMEGAQTDEHRAVARRAVAALRERDVDGVILGCTEIPFLLGEEAETSAYVNPLQLLAEEAVKAAIRA